jgi:hypothetical protein
MKNTKEINKWYEYRQNLNFEIVKTVDIEVCLDKFNEEIMSQLSDNRYILIIFKIKTSEGLFRSVSRMQRVNKAEFSKLYDILIESWNIKNEVYHSWLMECIIFNYILLPSEEEETKTSKLLKSKKEQKSPKKVYESIKMSGYNFPNTMDITEWGGVHFLNDYSEAIVYKSFSIAEYHVKIRDKYILVDYQINGNSILTFTDTMDDPTNLGTFTREFENQIYNFIDGELILKRRINKVSKLRTLKEELNYSNKFLTMDIETQRIDDKHKPYAVCLYDGKEKKSFYLSDYNDRDDLLISSIKHIMKRKYEGYKVYFHNFSNFDGKFYIKILTSLSDNIDPIIKDNDIINLLFKFSNKYCIYFRDSYLMFPSSLKELAKAFNVTNKSTFPYFFVNNPNTSLEYVGPIPSFEYFNEKGYTLEGFNEEFSSEYDKIVKI